MACISAETGTLTFAIINLVIVIGSSLLGVGFLIFWGVNAFANYTPWDRYETAMEIAQLAGILGFLFTLFISLLFSSFLMNGILKKKPEHIKVYYIFGIVKTILALTGLIIAFSAGAGIDIYVYAIVLGLYSIYALILYMIRYTYLQYETNRDQFDHKRLVEKC